MSRPLASADAFRAVADPTRRQILDLLRQRDHTAGDLTAHFKHTTATISHHLSVLRSAGMIRQTRQGTHRVYTLVPEALAAIRDWIGRYRLPAAAARHDR
jgi:DNA-binding transcriptional ArsR family regulator